MGIRFDRNTVRSTNGPMIFFSDPSAEADLGEEIRGAISSCLSFYAYRLPGDLMISFGSSEGVVRGLGKPGFVIAPFDSSKPLLTIPYRPCREMIRSASAETSVPEKSTTISEHRHEIETIQHRLSTLGGGKMIAARVIVTDQPIDVATAFQQLCQAYPSAFVFMFSTPLTGCWIGASPELLLAGRKGELSTMALAGTRPAGASGEWDQKNIEEQEMVADFIRECLDRHGLEPIEKKTTTRRAGPVEHLCTPITAKPQHQMTSEALHSLLTDLSPTPALCGLPKEAAFNTIKETETFNREYYGGFCGPYRNPEDFTLFATLRCACIGASRYAIYAGGGITLRSNAQTEWEETEIKADTLRNILESARL